MAPLSGHGLRAALEDISCRFWCKYLFELAISTRLHSERCRQRGLTDGERDRRLKISAVWHNSLGGMEPRMWHIAQTTYVVPRHRGFCTLVLFIITAMRNKLHFVIGETKLFFIKTLCAHAQRGLRYLVYKCVCLSATTFSWTTCNRPAKKWN